MFKNNKMQYVIRTCSSENVQELQNLLNEMAMNGWELYSMNEVEAEKDPFIGKVYARFKANMEKSLIDAL